MAHQAGRAGQVVPEREPSSNHALWMSCSSALCGTVGMRGGRTVCAAHDEMRVQEIGDLRQTLNGEVETLRTEFLDLKAVLKQQLGACASVNWAGP